MRILSLVTGLALAGVLAAAAPEARAQSDFSSSAAQAAGHFSAAQAATFSKQIEEDLADKGARVAMVFRTGRPRKALPPGINYTHGAFWVYRDIKTADGKELHGYAVYNLYSGDNSDLPRDRSILSQDFPYEFTQGSAVDDVGVIIPSPEMQRRMLAVIDSPTYEALHNPSYSLIANPLSDQHQNCVSLMLDVLAAAAWETADRAQIRANLRANFRPTPVRANLFQRMFGPIADPRLKTDDQSGRLVTATYESVRDFMSENRLLATAYSITYQPRP